MIEILSRAAKTWHQKRQIFLILLVIWGVTLLLALIWPISVPHKSRNEILSRGMNPTSLESLQKDGLEDFASLRRWGKSLREIQMETATRSGNTRRLNPELEKIGFIGLILAGDLKKVLLQLAPEEIRRFQIGETIPDGRILTQIENNSLTLDSNDGKSEILLLFPEAPKDGAPEEPISGDKP